MELVLASKSPRRRELLGILGAEFRVVCEETNENIDESKPVTDEIMRLSFDKAKAVQGKVKSDSVIIAADTVVVLGNKVFGKPKDADEAEKMLKTLSGKTHSVITGVTVLCGGKVDTRFSETKVTFRDLSDTEIKSYIATGDPFDKAGGYAIQGISCIFAKGINGDHFNVYGLPLCLLAEMLRGFGIKILGE